MISNPQVQMNVCAKFEEVEISGSREWVGYMYRTDAQPGNMLSQAQRHKNGTQVAAHGYVTTQGREN